MFANRVSLCLAATMLVGVAEAQIPPIPPTTKRPAIPLPEKKSPAATVENGPSATTAVYGDWLLRCNQQADVKMCEVAQTVYVQGQQNPVALVAIGREKQGQPMRLVLQVPINVTVSAKAKIAIKEGEPLVEFSFERCVPAGCFAIMQPADEAVRRLRERSEPARITYLDSSSKEIGLQFSLRGLGSALDALAKA
jgi:invasion protein IalB